MRRFAWLKCEEKHGSLDSFLYFVAFDRALWLVTASKLNRRHHIMPRTKRWSTAWITPWLWKIQRRPLIRNRDTVIINLITILTVNGQKIVSPQTFSSFDLRIVVCKAY